jgi:TatD DNase family protein
MWWDTHCHFTDDRLNDVPTLISQARQEGVTQIVVPSTSLADAYRAAALSEEHQLYFAAGIHPHDATILSDEQLTSFDSLIANPRCVAVGEIGLDYHYAIAEKSLQQQVFGSMLDLALRNNLPVVLHTRDAEEEVFDLVFKHKDLQGVCHSFTGEISTLGKFLDLGFYVSFNGMTTFPKSNNIRELAQFAPIDRILVETDAPYLAPVPHRGKTNVPAWIPLIGQMIAQIKLLPLEEVAEKTSNNAARLFQRVV